MNSGGIQKRTLAEIKKLASRYTNQQKKGK